MKEIIKFEVGKDYKCYSDFGVDIIHIVLRDKNNICFNILGENKIHCTKHYSNGIGFECIEWYEIGWIYNWSCSRDIVNN